MGQKIAICKIVVNDRDENARLGDEGVAVVAKDLSAKLPKLPDGMTWYPQLGNIRRKGYVTSYEVHFHPATVVEIED